MERTISKQSNLKEILEKLFTTKSVSKFNIVLNIVFCLLFCCTLLSIPLCSFNSKYLIFTWLFTVALLMTMFIKILISRKIMFNLHLISSYILLFLSMLLSSLLNLNGAFTLTPYLLICIILFSYIFFTIFPDIRKISYFLIYVSLVLFLFVFIFVYWKDLVSFEFYRLGDAFGDQNEVAMFLSLGACFSIYFIFLRKNLVIKIISLILLLLFIFCGFSTGSKLFIFTFGVSFVLLIFIFCGKKWWLALIILISFIGLAFFALSLPMFESYKERILGFFNFFSPKPTADADFSTYERFEMFAAGIQMFANKPIFGFGTLGFSQLSSFGKGCHNTIAQILCNYGILGSIFFFYPFVKTFLLFFTHKNKRNILLPFMIVLFFVLTMFSLYLDIQKNYAFIIPIVYSEIFANDEKNNFNFKNPIHIKTKKENAFNHNKPKLCFVISNFGLGGPQELVKNLAASINHNLFDVSIVVMINTINEKNMKFIETNNDINFYILNKEKGIFSLNFLFRLKETLDVIEPDIFSTHTNSLPYISFLNIFSKKPIIHTVHTLPNLDQRRFIRILLKPQIKNKQIKFVGCSKTIAKKTSELYKTKTYFINNGVYVCDGKISKPCIKYNFFTLGRIVDMKGLDFIISAFSEINKNNAYTLAIAGDGPAKDRLVKLVEEQKIKGVYFLGEITNVNELLSTSSIHLMASEWEANPMSILESMAYGIPTISTNVGGVPDVVVHGYNGFLFERGDFASMVKYLIELTNDNVYKQISNNCYTESKKYDIAETAKKYEIIFLEELK